MVCAVHQPQYLPWLGYFDKLFHSDVFVFLDDVQYKKNEWQNRNKILTPTGWCWLTVPVHYEFGQKINEIQINNGINWRKKHWHSMVSNYNKAKCFEDYKDFFESVYEKEWEYLCELNIYLIEKLFEFLSGRKSLRRSSELEIKGEKTARLVAICKKLNADTYLSGEGARKYLDLSLFAKAGIKVQFQKFTHPVYPQLWSPRVGFEPNLSIVDLLFNCGDKSKNILGVE